MTNLVFVEHKSIPRVQAKALREDLYTYAVSFAMRINSVNVPTEQRVQIAKASVRNLLRHCDFSTKNLTMLLQAEIVRNVKKVYEDLKQRTLNQQLLDLVTIVRSLRRTSPRKYKSLQKLLQEKLNGKQTAVFNIYLGFSPKRRGRTLTYKTVSRMSKIPAGTINPQMKQIVRSLDKILRKQRINHGKRTTEQRRTKTR